MFRRRRQLKPEFKVTQPLPDWGRILEQHGARGGGVFIHSGEVERRVRERQGRPQILGWAEAGAREAASLCVVA
ncbi:hypothetical protein SBV1_1240039 [Verrucomicrobia bacterium]|nr:hypothetical protein SBV1_1240039 [Verrucomicrobiota bacterium]